MLSYIKKRNLVYPWRLTQSAFSKCDMPESLTLFLNKNIFIEKGITLSWKQEKGSRSLFQRVGCRNVDAALAFQCLLSLSVSSLIAKVPCLMVYRRRKVRHGRWRCTCSKVASNSRACKRERKAGTFCISQVGIVSSTKHWETWKWNDTAVCSWLALIWYN